MTTRADVVAEARRWLGTPFHHQARLRGVGCDCGGLVGGVAVSLGLVDPRWGAATFDVEFAGYGRQPHAGLLRIVCDRFMRAIQTVEAQPGDVLLMSFAGGAPQHLGIIADYRHGGHSLVHALATAGRVVEHRLSPAWRGKAVAAYSLPGVEG